MTDAHETYLVGPERDLRPTHPSGPAEAPTPDAGWLDRHAKRLQALRHARRWGNDPREQDPGKADRPTTAPAKDRWHRQYAIGMMPERPSHKAVLAYVEDAMDAEGLQACEAEPSTIATAIGRDTLRVERLIDDLEERGRLTFKELGNGRLGLVVQVTPAEREAAKDALRVLIQRTREPTTWTAAADFPVGLTYRARPGQRPRPGSPMDSFRLVWRRRLWQSSLPVHAKLVGWAISLTVDATGDCPWRRYSYAEMGRLSGYSGRTARRAVALLEDVGLLDRDGGRGQRGMMFRLRLPRPALIASFYEYLGPQSLTAEAALESAENGVVERNVRCATPGQEADPPTLVRESGDPGGAAPTLNNYKPEETAGVVEDNSVMEEEVPHSGAAETRTVARKNDREQKQEGRPFGSTTRENSGAWEGAASPAWSAWWSRLMRHRPRNVGAAPLRHLAGIMEGVGSPDDSEAMRIYEGAVRKLLLARSYKPGFAEAVEALPADRDQLLQITEAVEAFEAVTGTSAAEGPPSKDLPGVVRSMAEVPDPETYVQHLYEQGFDHIPGIFHPNTLKRTKKTSLRGVFWDGGEGWSLDDLDIVTE